MWVILQNRCWVVHIPFVCMVRFKCLAQFPVDHLLHPVVYYYYYYAHCEFFTSASADGLSQESEWQQVSSCFRDSSQYSVRSQQCCSLDVSARPPISNSSSHLSKPLWTVPNSPTTIGIFLHSYVPQFFKFSSKVQVLVSVFAFYDFHSAIPWDGKVHYPASSLFLLLIITRSGQDFDSY